MKIKFRLQDCINPGLKPLPPPAATNTRHHHSVSMAKRKPSKCPPQTQTQTQTQTQSPTTISPISPSISSKIPFPSRKIRKLSSIASGDKVPLLNTLKSSIDDTIDENPSRPSSSLIKTLKPLTSDGEIEVALSHLRSSDPLLGTLIDAYRPPAFDSDRSPFLALAKSILYQQLAYKAAKSIYTRFVSLCGGEDLVLPDAVLSLSVQQLRDIGVSGRKASYLHDLSSKYKNGTLSDSSILDMDDDTLSTMLTMVKGIGAWSVHMFMIFSLHRPDVLPVGDLGVRKGVRLLYGLKELPRPLEMEDLCGKWKPYRSVGSWYMWRLMEAKGVVPKEQQ
ncbi:DNA-3-methyladenine glycosylase 1 [Ziziphus jujuba]|uniref:DNA-3-methyladenine glycosylase 1 n=2 Tax=Ziziphus jujuba TaxID=326968 RepID=A0A6P6GDW7_ZIZJJ|nr:DNA-3-methyladenine glycosylase 1 [Ziziphus jujuba]XP_048335263.1 DNA-3-methyladenine glycosylase 1 [Ziziphus jujuba]XP_048335264.1 DNA-3-methyladenine glycosylase 1 [Ziziphus jujuba]XP_048335265.1 DNA-3-methyladenine glycosylase 1 [Ziziphus jujuba]KAH7520026.1 hypothetical protein FEM48_Zijuj08G0100000 [Ziziphus jujuba var. spinosa]